MQKDKGKSGPKDLDANKSAIKMLEEESKDAQRIYEEETQSLKDQLDQRFVSQRRIGRIKQIDLKRNRVEIGTAEGRKRSKPRR